MAERYVQLHFQFTQLYGNSMQKKIMNIDHVTVLPMKQNDFYDVFISVFFLLKFFPVQSFLYSFFVSLMFYKIQNYDYKQNNKKK